MNDKPQASDERAPRDRICYPDDLKTRERQKVLDRRKKVDPQDSSPAKSRDEVGLALSGGGIRSATFCVGVLQAMADEKRRVLRKVDFLSTISGGGYAGSFLGRLFTREWVHDSREKLEGGKKATSEGGADKWQYPSAPSVPGPSEEHEHESWESLAPVASVIRDGDVPVERVERILDDHQSKPMVWLRESGRYLAPTGGGDAMLDVAVAFRNWAAVTVVTLSLLFTIFLAVTTVRALLWKYWPGWHDHIEGALIGRTDKHWWWSPWLLLPCLAFCFFTLPLGWAYWLTQKDRRSAQAVSTPGVFARMRDALLRPAVPVTLILLGAGGITLAGILGRVTTPPAGVLGKIMGISIPGIIVAGILAAAALLTLLYYWCARTKVIGQRRVESIDKYFPQIRNRLSKSLTVWFGVTLGLLAFAVMDSFGQMAYAMLRLENGPGIKSFLSVTGLLVLFTMAKRIKLLLDQLPDRKAAKVPLSVLASVAAAVIGGGVLVGVSAVSNGLVWQWANPGIALGPGRSETNAQARVLLPGTNLVAQFNGPRVKLNKDALIEVTEPRSDDGQPSTVLMNPKWTGLPALVALVLTFFFGHTLTFLNLSAHSTLYAARLTRAYHGASNPRRWSGEGQKLGDAMPFDDLLWHDYKPHDYGGPLHIVSATLNETVGGKSQVEDRDRHGMIMALGPVGLTVGARFHALWMEQRERKCTTDMVEAIPSRPDKTGLSFGYHPLHRRDQSQQDVESLRLSQWIGISGAAFSTGLGKGTSVGTSLIAGMANVRLGYWWDSHVKPRDRDDEAVRCNRAQLLWSRMLPVHAHLFDEFLAQFRGPNNRLWYLSDGGHFENTGAYELIRRQVPRIILCDCGADPDYKFEDLAALVRLARVDFGAEVKFLAGKEVSARFEGVAADFFGLPGDFDLEARAKKTGGDPSATKGPHALFAEVTYPDKDGNPQPQPGSYLLVLKPSVSGDESLDVRHYQSANPRFPQEPTSDQDFDEAQWESYRKLGRHIGEQIFPVEKPLWFTQGLPAPEARPAPVNRA